jgi:hypothetical protein
LGWSLLPLTRGLIALTLMGLGLLTLAPLGRRLASGPIGRALPLGLPALLLPSLLCLAATLLLPSLLCLAATLLLPSLLRLAAALRSLRLRALA